MLIVVTLSSWAFIRKSPPRQLTESQFVQNGSTSLISYAKDFCIDVPNNVRSKYKRGTSQRGIIFTYICSAEKAIDSCPIAIRCVSKHKRFLRDNLIMCVPYWYFEITTYRYSFDWFKISDLGFRIVQIYVYIIDLQLFRYLLLLPFCRLKCTFSSIMARFFTRESVFIHLSINDQ